MTFHLPVELEDQVREAVRLGRFSSVDAAMGEAVRLLICELGRTLTPEGGTAGPALDSSIGMMRDAADELDEIVADAYRRRRLES